MTDKGNPRLFWITGLSVVALDVVTKYFAAKYLPLYFPKRIVGNVVRLTLAYNPGAAFSMSLGGPAVSRVVFGTFAAVALVVLWRIYRTGPSHHWLRVFAVALAWGGAAGNLIDRIVSSRGVVDFIDIGVGSVRFWTFNVADSAVSVGAVLLAIVLWREDLHARTVSDDGGTPATSASSPRTDRVDVLPPTVT
jgi:signal peptidase II